jgi:hypothetical protein
LSRNKLTQNGSTRAHELLALMLMLSADTRVVARSSVAVSDPIRRRVIQRKRFFSRLPGGGHFDSVCKRTEQLAIAATCAM